jgi:hypothetical protein
MAMPEPEPIGDSREELRRARLNARNKQRRLRSAALRKQAADQRTRVARRTKAIEADLRKQLRAQGRIITVHDDVLVGNLAQCSLMLEVLRAEQSRGADIDPEEITRLANTASRLIGQLGLRPETAQPEAPRLGEYLKMREDRT